MSSVQNWLVHDHLQHEENLSRCKEAIKLEDWDTAGLIFEAFVTDLKSHIVQEEEQVFPIYDALVNIPHDPTGTLRTEHDRIIGFIKDLQQLLNIHDSEHGLECLLRLEDEITRHEEKEEDIFLPMAGYVLNIKREDLQGNTDSSRAFASVREWDF